MKKDIQNRVDIEKFVKTFYEKAFLDDEIGFIFTDIVKLNMETHAPKIINFWETILFDVQKYSGNPMDVHIAIDQMVELKPAFFERWLDIFEHNIDKHFQGEKADEAKKIAKLIAILMQSKVEGFRNKTLLQ